MTLLQMTTLMTITTKAATISNSMNYAKLTRWNLNRPLLKRVSYQPILDRLASGKVHMRSNSIALLASIHEEDKVKFEQSYEAQLYFSRIKRCE